MSSSNPAFCGICSEVFNEEERCPRNLPCSHRLCTECIGHLIDQDKKTCPFCRTDFDANSAEELMINDALMECIRNIPILVGKSRKRNVKMSSAFQKRITDFKDEVCKNNSTVLLELQGLNKDVERLLKGEHDHQRALLTLKKYLSEDVTAHIQRLTAKIDGYHEKSTATFLKLKDSQKLGKKNEEKLLSARDVLDSASTLQDASIIIDETEEINMHVRGWAEGFQDFLSKGDIKLQERNKELKMVERFQRNIREFFMNKHEDEAYQHIPMTGASANRMDLSSQVTALGLWEMRNPVKLLVEQGRVYALQVVNNKRRSGKIAVEDGKLLLYSLQDEEEPVTQAYYVQYDDVQSLATSPSSVFLDLRAKGLTAGRIYIHLNDYGKANNMHLHFTGGSGKCYSSKPLQIANKGQLWERVLLGYEASEAFSGNVAAYSVDGNHFTKGNSGLLWFLGGKKTPPLISIHTGPFQPNTGGPMGYVGEGLGVLSDVIYWSEDIMNVTVSQCGLVLPTKKPLEN